MARVNLLRLGKLVRERRGDRGIRVVAFEIGVSPATLSRVERGKLPDLDTFTKICEWLEVDPAEMLEMKKGIATRKEGQPNSDVVVAAHLRADPTQDPDAAQDIAQLIMAAQRTLAQQVE
ncbi:MAG: helix-turn-helix domain-containing protein [Terriglobia bacterium]